ncbi:MAG: hypothetical protein ACI9AB_001873, partial [Urechidicola sp.]
MNYSAVLSGGMTSSHATTKLLNLESLLTRKQPI